jgi:hypothetical protein
MWSVCAPMCALTVALVLVAYGRFLAWNERRAGKVRLCDPFLARFAPLCDASIPVLVLLYVNIALGVCEHAMNGTLCELFEVQILVIACRVPAMYLTPLRAPATIRPLRDPLTDLLRRIQGAGAGDADAAGGDWTDDLFFSGHTSLVMMMWLNAHSPASAWFHGASALAIAAGVLASHTHYTIDVYVVPFVCYTVQTMYARVFQYK